MAEAAPAPKSGPEKRVITALDIELGLVQLTDEQWALIEQRAAPILGRAAARHWLQEQAGHHAPDD